MKKATKFVSIIMVLVLFTLMAMGSGSKKEATQGSSDNSESLTIQEQKCFEHDGLTVTAKSIGEDSIFGTCVNLYIENNSSKTYGVATTAVIINNYMVSDVFSCTVTPSNKANQNLDLMFSQLKEAGIKNIGQIEIYFHLFDPDTYETLYEADPVTIKTSAFDKMDTTVLDDGAELVNKNGVRIVGKYVDDDILSKSVLLFIENKSSKNITVQNDNLSVNGYMINSIMSSEVYAGKMAIASITLSSTDLETNNITSIDTVKTKFKVLDSKSFDTIFESSEVSFNTK
jgi:hypothetical protein